VPDESGNYEISEAKKQSHTATEIAALPLHYIQGFGSLQ